MASIYDWSTTASQNDDADSAINWLEGQDPSDVNDSARAMMVRVAQILKDIGCVASAGGSANAITVTLSSAFASLANGRICGFIAANDNTGATTLSVNSLTAKSVRLITTSGDSALSGGEIQAGGLFICIYNTALNSGSGGWQLINPVLASAAADMTKAVYDPQNIADDAFDMANMTEATDAKVMTAAERTKIGYLTVTQSVDLDAIETRVNALDAAVILKGSWDASAGSFPGSGSAQAGESWIVSVAGTVDGTAFAVNDRIIAIVDSASSSTFAANWFKADYTDQFLSLDGSTGAATLGAIIAGATGKTTPVDGDTLALSDSAATNATKKLTWANLKATLWTSLGALIAGGTGKTTPVDADTLALSDSASSDATKKLTWANLKATLWTSLGALIAGGTGKTTPVDGDTLALSDSAASDASKKLTWANVKATLKTYFDTLYHSISSGQIAFPATQIPSSDANTLDDYEEGTWTPALTAATVGDLSVGYAAQAGRYIKIGKMVTVWFDVQLNTFTYTTASGNMRITGLPFTSQNSSMFYYGTCGFGNINKAGYTQVTPRLSSNTTQMNFVASAMASAVTTIAITDATSGSAVFIQGCITYEASA
jgi:hypothetical protein